MPKGKACRPAIIFQGRAVKPQGFILFKAHLKKDGLPKTMWVFGEWYYSNLSFLDSYNWTFEGIGDSS